MYMGASWAMGVRRRYNQHNDRAKAASGALVLM
jgi:hypothetical protein